MNPFLLFVQQFLISLISIINIMDEPTHSKGNESEYEDANFEVEEINEIFEEYEAGSSSNEERSNS